MHDSDTPLDKTERRRLESERFMIGNHLRKRRESARALEKALGALALKEKRLVVEKKRLETELRQLAEDIRSKEAEERSLERKLKRRSL